MLARSDVYRSSSFAKVRKFGKMGSNKKVYIVPQALGFEIEAAYEFCLKAAKLFVVAPAPIVTYMGSINA